MDRRTRYPAEVKERTVRMVFDHGSEQRLPLFDSGITAELLSPEQSGRVLEYGAGLTDLVKAGAAQVLTPVFTRSTTTFLRF